MKRWKKVLLCIVGGILLLLLLIGSQMVCISALVLYGVGIPECADGTMHVGAQVDASSLRRGQWGRVEVGAFTNYTTDSADGRYQASIGRITPSVTLVDAKKNETPLEPKKGWEDAYGDRQRAQVMLPKDLPDGDYRLRAKVETPLGDATVEAPLAIYAPAVIHVLTDRPLYEPGNTIKFRAVVLRARDLTPLDGRPGKWMVTDPSGQVVLEESAPAGEFGVVAGDFPLDQGAETGAWSIRWTSGGAQDQVSVRVEPFTLPRFSVEASSARPFYQAGQRPRVQGRVTYSSGAPVAGATLEISWRHQGAWPPPAGWLATKLPQRAVADPRGAFELLLPEIPRDLRGKATLFARISAVDPAGDRVEGAAAVSLSEDAIAVEAVTELAGGLVEGFNNRVYLRVTTSGGTPLAKSQLRVTRAWDPADEGMQAETDEDGVAALQLDPGPAVNIVIPPMPVRPPPKPPAVRRTSASELFKRGPPRLADQVALDRMNDRLASCARWIRGTSASVDVSVWVEPSGAVRDASGPRSRVGQCVAETIEKQRFGRGRDRIFLLSFGFNSDLPSIGFDLNSTGEPPDRLEQALEATMLDARGCLPDDVDEASLPRMLAYRLHQDRLETRWVTDTSISGAVVPSRVASCVEGRVKNLTLRKRDPDQDAPLADAQFGYARFTTAPAPRYQASRPQATTMLGYEMKVEAKTKDGEKLGQTKTRFSPGSVPNLRIRPSKVLADAGDRIEMKLIRGPSFSGKLPKKLVLRHEQKTLKADLDEATRSATFELPKELDGWFETKWSGARALVYVRPSSELTVAVESDQPQYRPRATAKLTVTTRAGGRPAPAAVGLFGVDQSLGQLAPLLGPDAMARIRPKVGMSGKAFGVLDAEALALGRIRGGNAAAATILKVASIPAKADYDSYVSADGRTHFDPIETLTDHFYGVLAELHTQVRGWEKSAPKGEMMSPPKMAELWSASIAACQKRDQATTDAYGRTLRLHHLPGDLLALTAPRAVVIEGTRLPEDVENWQKWVRRNRP